MGVMGARVNLSPPELLFAVHLTLHLADEVVPPLVVIAVAVEFRDCFCFFVGHSCPPFTFLMVRLIIMLMTGSKL